MPVSRLTREEAAARARRLRVDRYTVTLNLSGEGPTFRSETTVTFAAAEAGATTFVDLIAPEIASATLNGEALDTSRFDGERLYLPGLAAENTLRVVAECAYMHTGEGLHRFTDPVDGETYLYTQLEVADARRVFAAFDQPDLKATFQFTVTAPAHWRVVSTMPSPTPTPAGDGLTTWSFAPTPPLPSYVTALVAGPYHCVTSQVTLRDGRALPLGLYCRASLAQHLDAEALFAVTRQGFAFFEDAFATPFPFAKYDQLFVPELNAGAMENAGAVTIRDEYVFRSRVSEARYERRDETILHELAHMWFGDLVTMRWWDDLWLNESFATFASTLCQAEATRWANAWTTFANTEKTWAYRQDQLSSTHPIVAPIRDLEDVAVNFDGITYAKGASVLKQLVAWVGRDAFMAGLRTYFQRHAWANTTLADLLAELERTSGRDLRAWSQEWLETAGVNTLRPVFTLDDRQQLQSFAVEQEAPEAWPTLRAHRIAIGLYDLQDERLVRRERLEIDVAGPRTAVPRLVGRPRPALVLVNDDDLTYAKIRLDPGSLATVLGGIQRIAEPLPRALCWSAAWDMVRDAELPARDFLTLVLNGIAGEQDSSVIGTLLGQVAGATAFYVDPGYRQEADRRVAEALDRLMRAAEAGSNAQFQFLRAFVHHARTQDYLRTVQALLAGTLTLPDLEVDTDLRWNLLQQMVSMGWATEAEIAAEQERDPTAMGAEHAARARASMPTAAAKAAAWAAVVERDDLSNALQEATVGGFLVRGQEDLLRPYVERYFASIQHLWEARTFETARTLISGLFPRILGDQALLDRTTAWLEQAPDVPALRRLLAEERDSLVRALRAQACDAQAASSATTAPDSPHLTPLGA